MKQLKSIVFCALTVFVSGCADLIQSTTSAFKAPPPPRAYSQPAPGFNTQTLTKLAVFVQRGDFYDVPRGSDRLMEDEFISALFRKGYAVASRSDLEAVMRESRFQNSGLTEKDAAQIGRMLNVPGVLLININQFKITSDNTYTYNGQNVYWYQQIALGARLVSVEKAENLWIGRFSHTFRSKDREGAQSLIAAAQVVAESFPARTQTAPPPASNANATSSAGTGAPAQ